MLGTLIFLTSLTVVPQGTHAAPPDCALEVLPPEALEQRTLAEFNERLEQYVLLHRRLARSLPPALAFDDEGYMDQASDALADAIRAARPLARPGNVFTVAAADLVREIIARTSHRGWIAPEPAAVQPHNELLQRLQRPVVHGRLVWATDGAVPLPLLTALPSLPRELTYQIVGRDLVLVDVYAELIIDVLEDAFVDIGS
jgi:hypothetical protein